MEEKQIERLISSINKLNENIGKMDTNSTCYAIIMEKVTWILLFLAMIQIVLSFFPLLTYPWPVRLGMLVVSGIGFIYMAKHVTKEDGN